MKPLRIEVLPYHGEESQVDPQLILGLKGLMCPDEEECSIHLKPLSSASGVIVMVFLRRTAGVKVEPRWIIDHPKNSYEPYIYATLFENEPTEEIVAAVRHVLKVPETL